MSTINFNDKFEGTIEEILRESIIGQQRTGNKKQFVVMRTNFVYKFPFEEKRWQTLMKRGEILAKWKTPLVLLPERDITPQSLDFDVTLGNLRIVKYRNIETTPHSVLEKNAKFLEGESWGKHLSYYYLDRNNKNTNFDLEKLNYTINHSPWILEEYGYQLILAMVHLWILGCGDTGLSNILANKRLKLVHIIDFDENGGEDEDRPIFYFSKNPRADIKWYEKTKKHYKLVADELEKIVELSPDLSIRIRRAQELLRKYGISEVPSVISVSQNPQVSLGQMKIINKWNSLGYSGFYTDELKSGMQKYIRRGMFEKAVICAYELFKFVEIPGGIPIQSNMYNRLVVIAAEDVGLGNFDLVLAIIKFRLELNEREFPAVAAIIQQLCRSKKTRIMSQLARVYSPIGKKYIEENGLGIEVDTDDLIVGDNLNIIDGESDKFFKEGDPIELVEIAKMFYFRLKNKNPNCFFWLNKFLAESNNLKVVPRKRNTTNPLIIIWEMIREFLDETVADLLYKAWQKYEPNAFIRLAITRILYTVRKEPYYDVSQELEEAIEIWKTENGFLGKIMAGDYTLELDEYVIDMHTSRGKTLHGLDRKAFASTGAFVENKDMDYCVEIFEEIYINS